MFHVALVGCWHPHVGRYYPVLQNHDGVCLSCLWDSSEKRGRVWEKKLGVPFVKDYAELLKRPDVDAICVVAETSLHKDLMIAAAEAGKHIFTEKAFTLTLKDAEEVREAVLRNKVKFSIAYIRSCTPAFILGKTLKDAGLLGDLNMVRIRNGVNWAAGIDLPDTWFDRKVTGGGAYIDLCMHQMYLFDWLLGEPEDAAVNCIHYFGRDVEDNVCAVLRFKNGAMGVAESSATTFYSPYMYELYGARGSYLYRIDQPTAEIHLSGENFQAFQKQMAPGVKYEYEEIGGKMDNASVKTLFGARVVVRVQVDTLPACDEPIVQWLDACTKGTPIAFTIDNAVRLTRLAEGCSTALEWKKVVKF
ncbi:MAG: Gfo/Idh/MocA family oxidoreductase [Victivallaceae bacterium]|nr:Gfo/Idh/MocA family oxidoreductase [Victivallaceae bacterium]